MISTALGFKMKASYYYYRSDKSMVLELSCGIRGRCYNIFLNNMRDWRQTALFKILAFLETEPTKMYCVWAVFFVCFHLEGRLCAFFFFFVAFQARVTHFVLWSWVMIGCRRTRSTKTSTQSGTRSSLCEWLRGDVRHTRFVSLQ